MFSIDRRTFISSFVNRVVNAIPPQVMDQVQGVAEGMEDLGDPQALVMSRRIVLEGMAVTALGIAATACGESTPPPTRVPATDTLSTPATSRELDTKQPKEEVTKVTITSALTATQRATVTPTINAMQDTIQAQVELKSILEPFYTQGLPQYLELGGFNQDKSAILDKDGNMMLLKTPDGWVMAPYGMYLKDGMWRLYDEASKTPIPDYKIPDLDNKLKQIYDLVETHLDWNAVKPGTMGFIPGMNYGLEFKPGMDQKMYHDLVQSFLQTQYPQLRKFLAETGFTSESFLQRSKGPDGQLGWVPAVSPQGTHFVDIQGSIPTGVAMPQMHENIAINKDGGFYLDKLPMVVFSPYGPNGYRTNPFLRGWYQSLNKVNKSAIDTLIHAGNPGESDFAFGLIYDPAQKGMIFVVGSEVVDPRGRTEEYTIGGLHQQPRLEDGIYVSVLYELYRWSMTHVINNKFKYPALCPSLSATFCEEVPGIDDYSINYFKLAGQ